MFKWVWRFFSQKNSLRVRVVKALHGEDRKNGKKVQPRYLSTWLNIINEIESLKLHGIDLEVSSDPFNIYGLLDKRTKEVRTTESDRPPNRSERSNLKVLEEVANSVDRSSSESINNRIKLKEGGFILEILEEMITVGQTMGFSMEGCTKDMEKIIGTQGEQVVFR
nr:RNA-directed DNA polymerase, eukaryota, reverse transcriptase zinc-binding domain protein [Tanacetum cinerariifolium]